jgi:hypothetical protein
MIGQSVSGPAKGSRRSAQKNLQRDLRTNKGFALQKAGFIFAATARLASRAFTRIGRLGSRGLAKKSPRAFQPRGFSQVASEPNRYFRTIAVNG